MASEHLTTLVGGVYIFIGVVGFVCNTATVLMIATNRVYRLSAYTIMANIALADAIMMLVAGVVCGSLIAWTPMRKPPLNMKVDTAFGMPILIGSTSSGVSKPPIPNVQPLQSLERHQLFARESDSEVELYGPEKSPTFSYPDDYMHTGALVLAISLLEIAAWTAGVVSYAFLGFNRCIAIRFYGTKAKSVNRVSVALFASLVTWAIAIITGPLILFLFYFCC
uniref:G-protein coupled receptors family 1 profile domain-containing protein n=1 Tax=Parascaris univalens TaxID=6257 RepID=A0A914ZEZ9_PARUN